MEVNAGKRCLIARSSISLRTMLPWMTRPSTRLPVRVSNAASTGCPGLVRMVSISIPALRAAWPICARYGLAKGSVSSANTPIRRAEGANSRISSTLLPATSAPPLDSPVTLPPGRSKLATSPVATGSPAPAITIGISRVACFAANAVGVKNVTMRSTLTTAPAWRRFPTGELASHRPSESSRRRSSGLDVARVPQAVAQRLQERLRALESSCSRRGRRSCRPSPAARARRGRPRRCRAAKKLDEIAPPHSITSSARASSVAGTLRPIAFAIFQIDDEFEFRGLLSRDFRWLASLQDLDHEIDAPLECVGRIGTVRHEAADLGKRARESSRPAGARFIASSATVRLGRLPCMTRASAPSFKIVAKACSISSELRTVTGTHLDPRRLTREVNRFRGTTA